MIARCSPITPCRTKSRTRNHCGCVSMNASPIFTLVRFRASNSLFVSAAFKAIGFSHKTCFRASAALMDHGTMQMIRQWVVNRLNLRIGQQRLVGIMHLRNSKLRPASCPFCASREFAAIFAAPNTPHFTFFSAHQFLLDLHRSVLSRLGRFPKHRPIHNLS